jgi:hypothetical protein
MNGGLDLDNAGVVIKVLLLRDTSTYVFNKAHDFISDIFGNGGVEISVASYLRQTLGSKAVTVDDTNHRGVFDCANIQFGTLESGQTVEAALFYKHITNDADSIPLLFVNGKTFITAAAPAVASTSGSITGVTNANPGVVTSSGHGLTAGQKVYISGVGGMTEINDRVFTVATPLSGSFELSGENTLTYGTYTSGGTWYLVRDVYVDPLKFTIPDRSAVDFGGGATGDVNGATIKGARKVEVINLAAAVTEGDVADEVDTTINLPAALGNGEFNINIGSNGFWFSRNAL